MTRRFFLICAILAALTCTGPLVLGAGEAEANEIPYAKWQKLAAVHAVIADVNEASFLPAKAVYPSKGGQLHEVAVGRYLYWRIVNMFAPSARVDGLELNRLRLVCFPETPLVFKQVLCDMSARLTIVIDGRQRPVAVRLNRMKVGAWFDPARPDYAPTVHAELKKPLHRLLLALRAAVPGLSTPAEQ